jgi:hypothetical protein
MSSYAQQITVNFEEYEPKSTLVVPEHITTKAKFPFIDVHNHQWNLHEEKENLDKLITDMNALNMKLMVNLSGRGWTSDEAKSTQTLTKQIEQIKQYYPSRFAVFTNIDFANINTKGWTEKAVKTLKKM